MTTKKSRRGSSRKLTVRSKAPRYKAGKRTVRRHRSATAGKILPPLNVQSPKHLKEFERRIKKGDLTIILVWAQWCPHCHTMMPHFDAAAKSPNRSIQAVKVEETMVPAVNQILTKNINRDAKPLNVEGYPSIIVVDKKGNQVTNIEPVRDTATMTNVMAKAGPLAKEAGMNTVNEDTKSVAKSLNSIAKNDSMTNKVTVNNMENVETLTGTKKNNLMTNIGIEKEGLVSGTNTFESPKNFDVGEDELKGSIINNKSIKKNNTTNSITNKKINAEPAPIKITPPPESIKKIEEEAEEITSLAAPLTPPSIGNDIESISNSLSPEQKVSGGSYGGGRGGSLYSSLARTTYTLAPAAALLATAAIVMKKKQNKTHKKSKKSKKTHRRY